MPNLQEERSAETRRRLMEATVACLHERGYYGTTTVEIAARAGVSRGAQLHHFPTKDELVVKALEYVFDLRVQEMRDLVTALPPGTVEDRLCKLIDLLWPVFKGPTFFAWLELVVASRTEPTLREPVASASAQLGERVLHGFMKELEWPEDRPEELEALIDLIFGQLEAMALERELCGEIPEDPPQLVRALAWLKKLAGSVLASVHPAAAPN
ncbi:MAG: TetR/AcrR family transcriptional regulator [Candidatus Binataceae bacterium]